MVYELLENSKIERERADRLIDVLDAQSRALALRLAEMMADKFGGDVTDYLTDGAKRKTKK
jgi:hypothetical protein